MSKTLDGLSQLSQSREAEVGQAASLQPEEIDRLVMKAVFDDEPAKKIHQQSIRRLASDAGVFPASTHSLYEAAAQGLCSGMTVPAINIRGITYQVARAVFRAALKHQVGAFVLELARSEMGYTRQRPAEYAACVLAAALREGFKGPVFIQGDHFQVNRNDYSSEPEKELGAIRQLIEDAVDAGFLNIDIDASTLVDLTHPELDKQQALNCQVTADLTRFIRAIEPKTVSIAIGGEIGEVGKRNSTVEDLRAFMAGYLLRLGPDVKGISKISVQTGTTHGGVVLPDGSIARVNLDFETLAELSRVTRREYGMAGVVQHGASTLPDEAFHLFPEAGALEVHLATGFQNIIYDSSGFPKELLNEIHRYLSESCAGERKQGETDEQFFYKTRKRAFGPFKKEMWSLTEENLRVIMESLENRFSLVFQRLGVVGTAELVGRVVAKPRL